jgi:hypothetical protein
MKLTPPIHNAYTCSAPTYVHTFTRVPKPHTHLTLTGTHAHVSAVSGWWGQGTGNRAGVGHPAVEMAPWLDLVGRDGLKWEPQGLRSVWGGHRIPTELGRGQGARLVLVSKVISSPALLSSCRRA